jgi:ElaB/YqjD/DUF883 family membrane-anchored ribosome-binding protein
MTVEPFGAEAPFVVDGIGDTLDDAAKSARRVYKRTLSGMRATARNVDPFVRERPYLALGIGVATGVLLGLMWLGRPKVVYVRPIPAE